jgi:hypothetical protein
VFEQTKIACATRSVEAARSSPCSVTDNPVFPQRPSRVAAKLESEIYA